MLPGWACAQATQDAIRSFAGKQLILVRHGGEARIKLDRARLEQLSGSCEAAVAVSTADLEKVKARFLLEFIGTPELSTGPKSSCPRVQTNMELEISGFGADEPADRVAASLRLIRCCCSA